MKKQPRMQAIVGSTGSGKTTFMRTLLNDHQRCFVIDPTRDDEKFANYGPIASTLAEAAELSRAKTFRIRIVTENPLAFEFICRLAWMRGNCTLAIDEIHQFVPNVHNGISKWFKKLCLQGRHRGVSIIATSQRPANVHKDFLSEAATHGLHVFRTSSPWDLDALKKIVPNVESVRNFPIGKKLSWPR